MYPSTNINRCPVRLVDKYMGLCPPVDQKVKKRNFYLRSLTRTTPACWYSTRVLGVHSIKKTVGQLLKSADLDGFFSNHSLRRSSTTRLFQAGIDRKLIKEFTGHISDTVDKYQITSDAQRQKLSEVIAGEKVQKPSVRPVGKERDVYEQESSKNSLEVLVKDTAGPNNIGCVCSKSNINVSGSAGVAQLLGDILEGRKYGKAKMKLEIEFTE